MNDWKCQTCGATITEEDMQQKIEDDEAELEDISEVILVDCDKCDDEVATYKKTDTTDSNQESSNTTTRSKMLQAARS